LTVRFLNLVRINVYVACISVSTSQICLDILTEVATLSRINVE